MDISRQMTKDKIIDEPFSEVTIIKHLDYFIETIKLAKSNISSPLQKSLKQLNLELDKHNKLFKSKYKLVKIENPFENEHNLGLFDYSFYNDNKILIRLGAYKGCNILDKDDILKHFKSMNFFIKWCYGRISQEVLSKLKLPYQTDVKIIQKILSIYDPNVKYN